EKIAWHREMEGRGGGMAGLIEQEQARDLRGDERGRLHAHVQSASAVPRGPTRPRAAQPREKRSERAAELALAGATRGPEGRASARGGRRCGSSEPHAT